MTKDSQLGDAPIELQYRQRMKELGHLIDSYFNGMKAPGLPPGKKKTGFILMVFPFDEVQGEGRCNYLSNARRQDVVIMLKEQLARFQGQPKMSGKA